MNVTLLGEVERVTFENEATSFRVLRLREVQGLGEQRRVTVVGTVPSVGEGTRVRVDGRLEVDPKHGERVRADSLVVVVPENLGELEKYLGSGVVSGLGPGFAKRIVKYFGLETLRVLDFDGHRLIEVTGLGPAKVKEIRAGWLEHRSLSNIMLALAAFGVSSGLAQRILQRFGERAQAVIQESPYRLAIEVPGVGFKTADRIARARGLAADHPERLQAGLLHELREASDSGHCRVEQTLLLERSANALGVDAALLPAALEGVATDGWVVVEADGVYLTKLHEAEVRVARELKRLLAAPSHSLPELESSLAAFEASASIQLAEAQRAAVMAAAEQKFVLITGGPGVGKTTIVRAILSVLERRSLRVRLAAPTGRAAKRLTESTGVQATTLHRLLEVEGRGGRFQRHAENPLEVDLLIVDEASMIDVALMADLLEATPSAARVVLVGDADQLPSVGPGAVLHDLIASAVVPVSRLEVIFRQSEQSGIVRNSHRILHGEEPIGATEADGDFFIVSCSTPEKAASVVTELVTTRIPRRFGLDPLRQVQVLTPMHRGAVGTQALNARFQELLNAEGRGLSVGEGQLRMGDKVMQRKNDYDKEVFNGDLGEVIGCDVFAGSLTVAFDAEEGTRNVVYQRAELSQLSLAYAMTIHKSQGSEYPAVVVPMLSQHYVMLSRNLLYTAVTRAKRLCVLVVDSRALALALSETRKEERTTGLAQRLRAELAPSAAPSAAP